MSDAVFNELSEEEKQNFMRCEVCEEWFYQGSLDEVAFHCGDHLPAPDMQYVGSQRVE